MVVYMTGGPEIVLRALIDSEGVVKNVIGPMAPDVESQNDRLRPGQPMMANTFLQRFATGYGFDTYLQGQDDEVDEMIRQFNDEYGTPPAKYEDAS